MPARIAEAFERSRAQRRAALIVYLMAGDPDADRSLAATDAAIAGGADMLEIGIPYSDPLADGPAIQRAAARALSSGTSFGAALDVMRRVRERHPDIPLIAFTYFNPVFARGIARVAADLAAAGADGIIIPDLPLDEADAVEHEMRAREIATVLLIAPTTPDDRAALIAARSSGFVYLVSRMGVTGAGGPDEADLKRRIGTLKESTSKPLAVGFGISTPAHVALVARMADGVVVGSALVDEVGNGERKLGALTAALRAACAREGR